MKVRLILDSGSQHSYISSRVKEALHLIPEEECQLAIAAFGSKRSGAQTCGIVRVGMTTHHGPDIELTLLTVPYICEPLSVQPISLCRESFEHLMTLELADNADGSTPMEVDVLIGSDHYWRLMTGDIRRGEVGPVALYSRFGWVLSGPVSIVADQEMSAVNLITTHTMQVDVEPDSLKTLDERLHSFWNLESLGVSGEEDPLLEEFNNKVEFEDGRYEVSLPWRDYHSPLPTNYGLAAKRLGGLYRRLRQDPSVLQEYDRIIRDQLSKGIVQVVEPRDCGGQKLHYLPHHPVVRRDKETTKVRIVYDASARSTGPSLNDCLYPGPKFNQNILDIILRFQTYKVPLTGDIEKAFLMISVAEEDRDALRFLWYDDISVQEPTLVEMRFARVVFGVTCSPFLLNATVRHHLEQSIATHTETVTSILRSIYVDDVIFGAEDEEAAFKLYRESKEILGSGSFNLRKFISSCPSLQARIDEAEGVETPNQTKETEGDLVETFAKTTLGGVPLTKASEQKILGLCWDTLSDCFVFDLSKLAEFAVHLEPTKRNVVSMVGRFYDPIGVLSPIVVSFKVLIQEICESQVDWDQPLEEPQAEKWNSLVAGLKQALPISIPRGYFSSVNGQVESCSLYGFCDASKKAYAAVIYLVVLTPTQAYVQFVVSKTRVAPIQSQTIPRLELLSALLLARLMSTTVDALSPLLRLEPPRYYSDSQVALYWIRGHGKQWRPFVQNRVSEILKQTEKDSWQHCPGERNPADLPSRGLTPLELSASALWRRGPTWILENGGDLPTPDLSDMPDGCVSEVKATSKTASHSLLNPTPIAGVGALMKCEDYSSLARLLRVTTHVVRFARMLIKAIRRDNGTEPDTPDSVEAERLWMIEAQSAVVRDKSFSTWKKQFNLFLDPHGIWRCGGRLAEADVPYSAKHPVLLNRDHPLTTLIAWNAHIRVGHNGARDTLTEIRSRYWILRGRRGVRSIITRCILCRRFEGKAFTAPLPPPLPRFRVQESRPFSHTAVDFAGPIHVKTYGVTQSEKVWICLYTCCATRAVHIDVVPDMSTDTFVRSLKRFSARRGTPLVMVSDNAKTFKAAARVIQDVITHADVKRYCSDLSFEWHFNLEKAPWWGGMFERLIKSTKRCLRKMVGQASFSYDELLTAVVEIEAIINSRPLTHISSEDQEEPLTPSHLLCGYRLLSLPEHLTYCRPLDDEDFEVAPSEATRRVKHLHNALNHWWRRWRQEYLLELRESHRYSRGKEPAPAVEVGDIVLLYDDSLPRSFWKLVRVAELINGRDGKTRGAVVKVPDGNGHTTTLRCPLQSLYPLELKCKEQYEQPGESNESTEEPAVQPSEPNEQTIEPAVGTVVPSDQTTGDRVTRAHRPLRRAAAEARDLVSAQLLDLDVSDG